MFCPLDGTKLEFASSHIQAEDPELAKRTVDNIPSLFGDDDHPDEYDDAPQPAPEVTGLELPAEDPLLGTVIDKHYEIVSRIGSGGMSIVYLAKDLRLRKVVALKMMLPHLVANVQSLQRFQQEAEAASNLSHPNVVVVYNFGATRSNQPYLIMDYLQGKSLAHVIETEGRLDPARAVPIFMQIAGALAHAHEKGVIHRDLKPSNILLTETTEQADFVKIVDFGIAKILPTEGREAAQLTQTGEVFGSPLYMSPEQCRGEKLDARSDVYSMGCLMYETLIGFPPINGANMLEILFKHINDMPPRFSEATGGVQFSARLESIVFKALAKDPNERFQSMTALREELNHFQKEQSLNFIDVMRSKLAISWHKRKVLKRSEKIYLSAAAAFMVLSVVSVGWIVTLYISAATSPFSKLEVRWKEDELPAPPVFTDADISKANETARRAKGDVLNALKETSEPSYQEDEDTFLISVLKRLEDTAQTLSAKQHYEQAAQLYDKALEVEHDKKINGDDSMPVRTLVSDLAACYFKAGQYRSAAATYDRLLAIQASTNVTAQNSAETYAEAGDAYYFLGEFEKAKEHYVQACDKWTAIPDVLNVSEDDSEATSKASDGENKMFIPGPGAWFAPIHDKFALTTVGRLADCVRRAAERDPKQWNRAYPLYYQTAVSWFARADEGARDFAVSVYYLARVAQHLKQSELDYWNSIVQSSKSTAPTAVPQAAISQSAPAKAGQANSDREPLLYTMSIAQLYQLAVDTMKKACGEKSPMLGACLKGYSEFLFSKYDFGQALWTRLESLRVLSQAK
jgi:serine/threonine protein kinase